MTTVIRLDTNALKYFIESMGPEFKIEITRAVLAGAMQHSIKSVATNEVRKAFDEAVRVAVDEATIAEFGEVLRSSWGKMGTFVLSEKFKDTLAGTVGKEAERHARVVMSPKYVDENVEKVVGVVMADIEYKIERRIALRTDRMITEEVDRRVAFALANPPD